MIKFIGVGDNVVDLHYESGIMFPGGNAVNFSVFIRRLGYESAYVGVFGNDDESLIIQRALIDEGVDISRCVVRSGPTGRSGIHLIDGERKITEENDGGVVKSCPLILNQELLDYICSYDVIHTSYLSYIDDQLPRLRETGKPIVYDFSTFWTDDLFGKVCPNIDVAFLSGEGCGKNSNKRIVKKIIEMYGNTLVVMTMGGNGALVFNGDNWYENTPYNFDGSAVDTTGAGDSWLAGFVSTYFQYSILCDRLNSDPRKTVLRDIDRADYLKRLIPFAMANGNLLARYNCQFNGSFGHGGSVITSPFEGECC